MPADGSEERRYVLFSSDCHAGADLRDEIATPLRQGEIPRDPNFLPLITPTGGFNAMDQQPQQR